jgi:hypothetical protein
MVTELLEIPAASGTSAPRSMLSEIDVSEKPALSYHRAKGIE